MQPTVTKRKPAKVRAATEVILLRVADAAHSVGISISEFYDRTHRGTMPPLLKIGKRASRVPSNEVEAVITAHIAGKSETQIKLMVAEMVAARTRLTDAA